jgi:RNA recognition motif-containing protein
LLKDKEGDTEKTKGIAFVEFISPEDALKFMSYLIVD